MTVNDNQTPNSTSDNGLSETRCAEMYTAKAGDTLYSIANRFNVSVESLMVVNQVRNPYALRIGQPLCIPQPITNLASCTGAHTIRAGDTLYLVARQYGVPLSELMQANPTMDPYNLQIGDVLCIPPIIPPSTGEATGTNLGMAGEGGTGYQPITPVEPAQTTSTPDIPEVPKKGAVLVSSERITPVPAPPSTSPQNDSNNTSGVPNNMNPNVQCSNGVLYHVQSGETLTDLLAKFNLSFAALMNNNPGIDFSDSLEEVTLCVPTFDYARRCRIQDSYIVRAGDDINKIASNMGVTTDDLLRFNPMHNVMDFSTKGMKICLPR